MMAVHMSELMCEHMIEMGGITHYEALAEKKASQIYRILDYLSPFYSNSVDPRLRSKMNVPFNMANKDLEPHLLQELKEEGYCGLKGHRSLGGLRASIYNSLPYQSVESLTAFLEDYWHHAGGHDPFA